MSNEILSHIVKFFTGDTEPSAEEQQKLFEEALLMTLSRATVADSHINVVEVEKAQKIYKEVTGHDVQETDIRVAALSDLYEEATLEKYLSNVSGKIPASNRLIVVNSLASLIKIDGKVSPFEIEFFNNVVAALQVTPSQMAGLQEDTIKV